MSAGLRPGRRPRTIKLYVRLTDFTCRKGVFFLSRELLEKDGGERGQLRSFRAADDELLARVLVHAHREGLRVWDSGLSVQGRGFMVGGLRFRVQDLACGVGSEKGEDAECEVRIGTGPSRARTHVIYVE